MAKLSHKKIVLILFGIIFLFFGLLITAFLPGHFSKKEITASLAEQNVYLKDEYQIISNKKSYGITGSYLTFELKISENDKEVAIKKIKDSADFNSDKENIPVCCGNDYYEGDIVTINYEKEPHIFIHEYFKPSGKGWSPIYKTISVDKERSILTFEDIDY